MSTSDQGPAAMYLYEVASLDPTLHADSLEVALRRCSVALRIVGVLAGYPATIVETNADCADELLTQLTSSVPVTVTELRRRFRGVDLTPARLVELITDARRGHRRLAVGAAAVERAAQRRRLELLVVASEPTTEYIELVQAFTQSSGYGGPIMLTTLSGQELGAAAGVKRAGCVGLLRRPQHA